MEYQGKEKSPYYGVWQSAVILTIVPIAVTLFFYWVIGKYSNMNDQQVLYSSIAFGCGVAFLFQLMCIIAGLFKGTLKVVINRLKEFVSNLSISAKFAFTYYFENIKSEGIVFWIFFVIIGTTLFMTLFGVFSYISVM